MHSDYSLMTGDNVHYTFNKVDSYDKPFNFINSCRGSGKSTSIIRKCYNNWVKTGDPCILAKRRTVDITDTWLGDLETLIHKFIPDDGVKPTLLFNKGSIAQGMVDVKVDDEIIFRVISLSAPMSRLKSMVLRNVRYYVHDEYICNTAVGESYLKEEVLKFKEIYTTYNREASKGNIKCYWLGNPYSLFNPYMSWIKAPINRFKIGDIFVGQNYIVDNYKISTVLYNWIVEHNPLFEFEDEYTKYALAGESVNDSYIKIIEKQPDYYKLWLIFKVNKTYIAVFRYNGRLWIRKSDKQEFSQNRHVFAFNYRDMSDDNILHDNLLRFSEYIRVYLESNRVFYQDVEACYTLEEIYTTI